MKGICRHLLLLLLGVTGGGDLLVEGRAAKESHHDYTLLEGDIQVPLQAGEREGRLLGSSFATTSNLWPEGKVRYYIETAETNPRNPAGSFLLPADDWRILNAVAHWEAKTCIRFTRCATKAGCAKPYVYFISDKNACNSPLGMTQDVDDVNQVNLASSCSGGSTIHELGHSLGLMHEQTRNDRDSYVFVDTAEIKPSELGQFSKTGAAGRSIGAYDYGSIMHYGAFYFATGSSPSIVAPAPIGQQVRLSAGDVDTIDFMYNGCVKEFTAPTCRTSRGGGGAAKKHLIPHSKEWLVEFNGLYAEGKTMTVSYGETTAPGARTTKTVADGGNIWRVGFTQVAFTPDTSDVGKDFVLATTFKGSDGVETTCAVGVTVVNAEAVCFGVPANDAKVCGERGTCTNDAKSPCKCDGGYGGLECTGFADCPANQVNAFDGDLGSWESTGDPGSSLLDVAKFAEGTGSWKLGDENDDTVFGAGKLGLGTHSKPRRITFYAARFADPETPAAFFSSSAGTCFSVRYANGAWRLGFTAAATATLKAEPKEFYHFDLHVDWAGAGKVDLYVDGKKEATSGFSSSCPDGISKVSLSGGAWFDEFHLWCTDYILMTGSVVEGLTQDQLRAGGTTMTLTLVGDHDEWVDSEATKQAVIEAMVPDHLSATGWDGLRGTMLDTSLVTIAGQVVTLGPLKAAPTFRTSATELVDLYLTGAMFKSGTKPVWSHKDLEFQIPGECHHSVNLPFDDPATVASSIAEVTTAVKKEGAGSFTFKDYGFLYSSSTGGIRASTLSFFAQIEKENVQLAVSLKAATAESIRVYIGIGDSFGVRLDADPTSYFGKVNLGTWHKVELALNWETKDITVTLDGVVETSVAPKIPNGFESVAELQFSTSPAGTGACYIDSVALLCGHRDPQLSLTPACPKPGKDAPVFHFYPGTDKLSASDKVAIVAGTTTDCKNAETECVALDGCSASVGSMVRVGTATEWSPSTLPKLQGETEYKVCYRPESYRQWILIDNSFTTCAVEKTDAPDTPAPDTPAPDTLAPDTSAPDTSSPGTPAPKTSAPDTLAPRTTAPDTLAPKTPTPDTSAPETSAPATRTPTTLTPGKTAAPDTPAPETLVPDTTSPVTSSPRTPAPNTTPPVTSAPATQTPATLTPGKTAAPVTPAPRTPVPDTAAPATSAPATQTPTTLTPGKTAAPETPAPRTPVPDTAAPATSVPATLTPGKTAAPDTPAPKTGSPATTAAPATLTPGDTAAPSTEAPSTAAPETLSPGSTSTEPPRTASPGGNGTTTDTVAPSKETTEAPRTFSPGDGGVPETVSPSNESSGTRSAPELGGEEAPVMQPEEDGGSFPWYIVAIAGSVLALCAGVAGIMIVRHRANMVTLDEFTECMASNEPPTQSERLYL
eukprot:TRINITY_DN167_c0_g1_i6.p1 TRINITY_DN167_c0_g1~~TRINITY_DN167_c0_g1_i6.p1  ORF type:complete len:1430 (+),score=464.76 TRINITY_DN167_c0_g1_i6:115-4290(+)